MEPPLAIEVAAISGNDDQLDKVAIDLFGGNEPDIDCTVGELRCHECPIELTADGHDIDEALRRNPELPGVVIVEGGEVVAVLSRQHWLEQLSQPFRAELYLNHPVSRAVVALTSDWLTLAATTPVHQAVEMALARRRNALFDPILVDFPDGGHRLLDAHLLFMAQSRIFALARERSESLRRDVEVYAEQLEKTVADLRETQDSLVEARRLAALARLVAGMAHEINTPVGIALTAVTHLEESFANLKAAVTEGKLRRVDMDRFLASAGESATLARANVQRAADLMRSFKRVAVDETSEVRRQFELASYLAEVVLSLRPILKRLPHRIQIDCSQGIVMDSYPGALAQVLSNLMMNAVEHAFADGRTGAVNIACQQKNHSVEIVFSDDGCGIAAADQVHLFEPFFTTRGHAGGSGLGLHIVFNLVTGVLKGSIECKSVPGQGTAFTIDIPLEVPA